MSPRVNLVSVLTTVVVLALGCAVWFGLQAHALTSGDPAANAALVDPAATGAVTDQVGAGVKAVFSYDYSDLARTERAAADVLVGSAATTYHASLAAAEKQATEQKLVRTTTVRSIGLRELSGDRATVLLFLDQQTLHTVGNQQDSAGAQLLATAERVDGRWKIATLTPL
jgi:Mce-associated membrane protein